MYCGSGNINNFISSIVLHSVQILYILFYKMRCCEIDLIWFGDLLNPNAFKCLWVQSAFSRCHLGICTAVYTKEGVTGFLCIHFIINISELRVGLVSLQSTLNTFRPLLLHYYVYIYKYIDRHRHTLHIHISWCCEALLIIAVQLSGSAIICMSSAVMEICFVTAMEIERDVWVSRVIGYGNS